MHIFLGDVGTRKSALVVVDMLNSYEHDDAEPLTKSVETIIDPMSKLIACAQAESVDVIT